MDKSHREKRLSIDDNVCYRLRRIGACSTIKEVDDVFLLERDTTVIGRAKNKVDFFIDSSKNKALISRIHARILRSKTQFGKDVFKIQDVSLNGTYLNDRKISCEALLKPGDVLVFGHLQGACLEPGKVYKQSNSEFKFLFESFHYGKKSGNDLTTAQATTDVLDKPPRLNFSNLLETPTAPSLLSESSNSHKRCKLTKIFQNSEANDSYSDYKMLQEYASSAALAFSKQNESNEDLFSVKCTQLLPECSNHARSQDKAKQEKTKRPEKRRRQSKEESKSHNTNATDTCSASKCLNPDDKIVSWVQCDDCEKWYHIKCCGLSLRLVKVKNSKFHCGCS